MDDDIKIYVDLDNVLIHAVWGGNPNKKRTKIDLGPKEVYWSSCRIGSREFIDQCRKWAPTFMLTSATKDYAQAHNNVFNFGFTDEEIIARYDYSCELHGAYGSNTVPTNANVATKGILIDDKDPREAPAQTKMMYLGINTDRYVRSRDFRGGNYLKDFDKELDAIKKIIYGNE